jgi:hypothetical protein
MAPQESDLRLDIVAFASRLLEVHEPGARARVTAQAVLEWLPGTTVTVYILQEDAEKSSAIVNLTPGPPEVNCGLNVPRGTLLLGRSPTAGL